MATKRCTLNLKYQARCIAAQPSSQDNRSRWLAGTTALREHNELQVLEHNADKDELRVRNSYSHPGEIWHLSCSPSQPSLAAAVFNQDKASKAGVWKLEADLQPVAELPSQEVPFRQMLWATAEQDRLASVEGSGLRLWSLQGSQVQEAGRGSLKDMGELFCGCWDPHDPSRLVTGGGNCLQVWDTRSMAVGGAVEAAHSSPVRDMDLSRHHQHLAVSGGDDGRVFMWDLRALGSGMTPIAEMADHRHWVWQSKFSPHHSQMVLSSSSDSSVRLTHMGALPKSFSSPSSAQSAKGPAATASSSVSFDDHEDSIYGVAWSSVDPWTFASVSYDGRVAVNTVPSQIKYKILI